MTGKESVSVLEPRVRLEKERLASKEQRLNNIIKAARTVFLEKGLEETTMQDISNEASIGIATLFRYFPRKEKLIVTTIINIIEDNIPVFQAAENSEGTCLQKIEKIFDIYIMLNKEKQKRIRLIASFETFAAQHAVPLEDIDIYSSTFEKIKIIFTRIIEEGKKDGSIRQDIEVEDTLNVMINAFNAFAARLSIPKKNMGLNSNKLEPEEELSVLKTIFINYLKPSK